MQSFRIFVALSFVLVAHAQSTKVAKIEEIFRLTNVDQMQKKIADQITAGLPAQMAQLGGTEDTQAQAAAFTKEITKLIFDNMSWQKMKPLYIRVYDETFSEDEISGLLLFYQSSAGKAFNEKLPLLTTKVIALSQQQMKELAPEIQAKMKELTEKNKNQKQ